MYNNAYTEAADKIGGASPNVYSMKKFNNCILNCGLLDMGFKGPKYTWEGRGIKERIDRGLCNTTWRMRFQEASPLHLPPLQSDHRPLLLKLVNPCPIIRVERPFRFMAGWLADKTFRRVVEEAWKNNDEWSCASAKFVQKAKEWNISHFGNILPKKRVLMNRMEGVNRKLERLDRKDNFGWRAHNLSFAGRITLVQSVLRALPTYVMQTTMLPKAVCRALERLMRNFLWGASRDKKAWHSISWEKICKPKQLGGLGIRNIHDFNCALIMKVGWNLIINPDAFWVKVIRSKYSCGSGTIPLVRNRMNASNVWRGINSVWPHVTRGMRWILGNGKGVNFWNHVWLPCGTKLADLATAPLPLEVAHLTVADMVENGAWNSTLLQSLLPVQVLGKATTI
ncbi:Endonuclease/exonuclease/phosphatase superfamily [Sesbania bispinosa]|nr:Endonuclease/exonuclease/phosphatase superfamily [Sesbania bispinosa]